MDSRQRHLFNSSFSIKSYIDFLAELNAGYPEIPFRVAETPLFLTDDFKGQLLQAGDEVVKFIASDGFRDLTDRSIPDNWYVPNENAHPHFLSLDFGLCEDNNGQIVPKLIELQGFPSLFGFQFHLAEHYRSAFGISDDWTIFNNSMSDEDYFSKLRRLIVGDVDPRQVVMLDYHPKQQKTAIDFYLSARYLGLKVLSVEEVLAEGKTLYYVEGEKIVPIKRIYNRLIFDELEKCEDVAFKAFDPRKEYEVEWITHPHWFYRVSKFTMPFLKGNYVPDTWFLNELKEIPEDLENYVVKPLFSFAGLGVIIDLNLEDILSIQDPENWILQRKVKYASVIPSPQGNKVKAEIRLMYIWEDNKTPELLINLTRLSKGDRVGVRYNSDSDWVGGSVAFIKKTNH